ncbi:hypothetical protein [Rossellomorea vietnamensis]|jgi:hypothetical protein|uniref:hypothetical protein n=1 Tax=Rossellomorea vietnamensis TaxID=218284 RepID=UPI003D2D3D8E
MKKFSLGVLLVVAGINLLSGDIQWENRVYSIQAKVGSHPELIVEVIIKDNVSLKAE